MKNRSHPPLVILFDLLFMLLFVSVLNQERVLAIHLAAGPLPADVRVLGGGDDQALARQAKALAAETGSGDGGFGFLLPCEGRSECRGLGSAAGLVLPDALYREVSQIATTPFAAGQCRRLNFQIRANDRGRAVIDYQRLRAENPCLLKIEGFAAWLDRRQ